MSQAVRTELLVRGRTLLLEKGLEAFSFDACRKAGKEISSGSAYHAFKHGRIDLLLGLYGEFAAEIAGIVARAVGPHSSDGGAAVEALARALSAHAWVHAREARCFLELRQSLGRVGKPEEWREVERSLSAWAVPFRLANLIDPHLMTMLVPTLICLPMMITLESGEADHGDAVAEVLRRTVSQRSTAQKPAKESAGPDLFNPGST